MAETELYYLVQTSKSIENVFSDLEASVKEEGFGVLWQFDVHKKLEEKGLTAKKETTVLEVCHPQEAATLLELDYLASFIIPCKIVVIAEEDHIKVGLLKPTAMTKFLENDEAKEHAKDIERRLISAVDRVV